MWQRGSNSTGSRRGCNEESLRRHRKSPNPRAVPALQPFGSLQAPSGFGRHTGAPWRILCPVLALQTTAVCREHRMRWSNAVRGPSAPGLAASSKKDDTPQN